MLLSFRLRFANLLQTRFVGLLLVIACFLAGYSSILSKLFAEWTREEYSHGFLLPFLALLMLWHRVGGMPRSEASPYGLLWMSSSVLMLAISELSTFRQLGFLSLVVLFVGVSLLCLGSRATRRATPAFLLLLFAIPLPYMIHNNLSFHLKVLSSDLGVGILKLIGVSVYQEGNVIDLGSYKLQVVDACNGLRYLFPAACFGYLVAYAMRAPFWMRLGLFLSSVPLTIGMNALRIAAVGVTVNIWGTQAAEGFIHFFEGYVVFLICILLLLAEASCFTRFCRNGAMDFSVLSVPSSRLPVCSVKKGSLVMGVFVLAALCAGLAYTGARNKQVDIPAPHLSSFPLSFGNWAGATQAIHPSILKDLTLSDYLNADFRQKGSEGTVNFYVAYYARQEIGSAAHSPETCVPGSGWRIEKSEKIILPVARGDGAVLPVMRMLISSGQNKQLLYYWFEERGRGITSQFQAKWYLMVDSLKSGRSDGALVRVTTLLSPGEAEADADSRLTSFLKETAPLITGRLSPPPR